MRSLTYRAVACRPTPLPLHTTADSPVCYAFVPSTGRSGPSFRSHVAGPLLRSWLRFTGLHFFCYLCHTPRTWFTFSLPTLFGFYLPPHAAPHRTTLHLLRFFLRTVHLLLPCTTHIRTHVTAYFCGFTRCYTPAFTLHSHPYARCLACLLYLWMPLLTPDFHPFTHYTLLFTSLRVYLLFCVTYVVLTTFYALPFTLDYVLLHLPFVYALILLFDYLRS